MARLLISAPGAEHHVFELRLGANRVGRSDTNELVLLHPTVSSRHCEILLSFEGLVLRDCGSTNGVFLDEVRVEEARVSPGQTIRVGDVKLVVESIDLSVSIPRIEVARPAPPVMKQDGALDCPRHAGSTVTHQCTFCREVLCPECVHVLRLRGGKSLLLCPLCSHDVVELGAVGKKKKKSLLSFLSRTVKVPFRR